MGSGIMSIGDGATSWLLNYLRKQSVLSVLFFLSFCALASSFFYLIVLSYRCGGEHYIYDPLTPESLFFIGCSELFLVFCLILGFLFSMILGTNVTLKMVIFLFLKSFFAGICISTIYFFIIRSFDLCWTLNITILSLIGIVIVVLYSFVAIVLSKTLCDFLRYIIKHLVSAFRSS